MKHFILFVFLTSVVIAEPVWVRSYKISDNSQIKSYGPIDRTEVRTHESFTNIIYISQAAFDLNSTAQEITDAITLSTKDKSIETIIEDKKRILAIDEALKDGTISAADKVLLQAEKDKL